MYSKTTLLIGRPRLHWSPHSCRARFAQWGIYFLSNGALFILQHHTVSIQLSALIHSCPAESRDQLLLYRPRISGVTALHRCAAAVIPSCESARILLAACSDSGSSLLAAQNLYGETALHIAAHRVCKDFLLTLLGRVDKPMLLVNGIKGKIT